VSNLTFASLFTGFGGSDLGAIQAGLTPIWGIEKDPDIAKACQTDFVPPIYPVAVEKMKSWELLAHPDWLHASPPCTTATVVNDKKESQEDIELAEAVCRAIEVLQPEYFSLENVAGYAKYKSFSIIKNCLTRFDYHMDLAVLNCANYGVPQTRLRLFLVASKKPIKHIFANMQRVKNQVSWYDAIADLIPTLTPTTLTGWQKQAIHKNWPDMVIQRSGARKKDGIPNNTIRLKDEPMFTIKAMGGKVRVSAKQATIVIDGQAYEADTRCLMRWQTFPDDYQISGNLILDTKGIGNAVPPLMFKQIVRSVLNGN
jgi:DNA (cytosine-5)-methyltransferase 1